VAEDSCTKLVQPHLDQLMTAVVMLDQHLRISYMNAAAETILDGSRHRLQQHDFFSIFSYCSLPVTTLKLALQEQQSVADSEVILAFSDGQRMTIELNAQPVRDDKGDLYILLELRRMDQIQRINQETTQQQQLMAAQSMVRGMAHEIKNPLGGLRGAAQLLASELPNQELREYTTLIMTQADRLSNLVDRMLGSHSIPTSSMTNIHALLERVLQVAKLGLGQSVQWVRDYDPSLPELAMAEEQLEQALLNIVINACEAVQEQRDAQVIVRTRIAHQQTLYGKRYRQCAVIVVQDNGPGVPATLRDTLFYPMVSGRAGGTGLGLSIAQSIVHQHAGKIEVHSEPNHTEFRVYLPYINTLCAERS
jgi:two-component system, NtrC family, nitrogen regulation sensor histidine kinase GlnL